MAKVSQSFFKNLIAPVANYQFPIINKPGRKRHYRPLLESLEKRCLLAAPIWADIGPNPQLNDPDTGNQDVSGRVSALAVLNDYYAKGHPGKIGVSSVFLENWCQFCFPGGKQN
jgi:hypothetical protein